MATYDRDGATLKALELVSHAIQAGMLKGVDPSAFGNPAQAGKETGQFIGSIIKELAAQIESL